MSRMAERAAKRGKVTETAKATSTARKPVAANHGATISTDRRQALQNKRAATEGAVTKNQPMKTGPAIGALLRARRQSLDLTLEFVAAAADLTKGFLSDVERDKASPSVASLIRLCDVLNIPIGSLFASVGSSVIRKEDRVPIKFGGSNIQDYLLTPSSAAKGQAILSDIAPGGSGGTALYTLRCEEEFIFVLDGSLTITLEEEETVLRTGDAMTFDPRRPHTFRNTSATKPAQALFMVMPPSR